MSVIRKRHVVRCSKKITLSIIQEITLSIAQNHVARYSKFRCQLFKNPLPIALIFVARR